MNKFELKESTSLEEAIKQFYNIIAILRSPDGCPWDREQSPKTTIEKMIEEAYEVIDAILKDNDEEVKEELGDLLLHIVMISQMYEEKGLFSIVDVINGIANKMVRRHPHVFGDEKVETAEETIELWKKIKKEEKKGTVKKSLMEASSSLPPLSKAEKIQKIAEKEGFDWPSYHGALEKLEEETLELVELLEEPTPNRGKIEEEMGDILFSAVNVARKLDIDPAVALAKANQKFIKRYKYIEENRKENSSLEELDNLWEKAKESE